MMAMKKSAFCLAVLVLLSSLGIVALCETVASEPMDLTIAVDLADSNFSRTYFNEEDISGGPGWLEFEVWFRERYGVGHTLVIRGPASIEEADPRLVEAGSVHEDIVNWIQPKGESPERSIIDVFIVSYDPAYVTLPFDETVSIAGMILVGYKENSPYPDVAKAVAEYFAEKAGVQAIAAVVE